MTITIQGIEDRYNTLFLTLNGGVSKTFSQLTMAEKQLTLLLLNVENVSSGGGGIADSVSVTNFPSDPAKDATIQQIRDRIPQTINNRVPVVLPTGIVESTGSFVTSEAGVLSGKSSYFIGVSGDAPATIEGLTYPPLVKLSRTAQPGNTLAPIAYDATGTELTILWTAIN